MKRKKHLKWVMLILGMGLSCHVTACHPDPWTEQACPLPLPQPVYARQFETHKGELSMAVWQILRSQIKQNFNRSALNQSELNLQILNKDNIKLASKAQSDQSLGCVNINTDGIERLQLLPGVGGRRAQNMINFRQKRGFKKKRDVMKIKGIGKKAYQKMAPLICDI